MAPDNPPSGTPPRQAVPASGGSGGATGGNGGATGGNGDSVSISGVDPSEGPPGTTITITGSGFGPPQLPPGSKLLRAVTIDRVTATVSSWSPTAITTKIPTLPGGTVILKVAVGAASDTSPVTVFETVPPAIAGVTPAVAFENMAVVIDGQHLGRKTDTSAVLFAGVRAIVTSWLPTRIQVEVPPLAALGGVGSKPITVQTPWGWNVHDFTIANAPQIASIDPPTVSPQQQITINGQFFGSAAGRVELIDTYIDDVGGKQTSIVAIPILQWSDTLIRAAVPGLPTLLTTGRRQVRVTNEIGPGALLGSVTINDLASITSWTRLEPHPRLDDLEAGLSTGLQARVYDPLWLLGRQWQMREFEGEDAGSPIHAQISGAAAPLTRRRLGDGTWEELAPGALDAVVESEPVFPPAGSGALADRRLAAEAGLQFMRQLDAHLAAKAADYRRRYLTQYAIQAPSADEAARLDPATRRFLAVTVGRVPDGARLYQDLHQALPPSKGGTGQLPAQPAVDVADQAAVLSAVSDWFDWCLSFADEPPPSSRDWVPERMEYSFAIAARLPNEQAILSAAEYTGESLDWYSFAREMGDAFGTAFPALDAIQQSTVPSPAAFAGMPATRWWEMDDARVDFGAITAGAGDLVRLLFVEFATVYANDWSIVHVDQIPSRSICSLTSIVITDTFGFATTATPFNGDPNPGARWRMFQLSGPEPDGRPDLLLLPGAAPPSGESLPLEDVMLVRDELASMAWAVERVVESPGGRPLDRATDYASSHPPTPSPAASGGLRYRLMSTIPTYWIPLVPVTANDATGQMSRRLQRNAMRDEQSGAAIPPLGRLLSERDPLLLYDEEIPRAGARVTRRWRRKRDPDGRTHLWIGRHKGSGRGEGSSGLRFDEVDGDSG